MSDEEIIKLYEAMQKMFPDLKIPSPIHEPIQFYHLYKIYKFYESQKT